ncbi:CRISPR-associated helicase Cas3' [Paeniglutamicibacter sp. NPDC091659]|uniref:CRISPR-associated helicase Cas3' n=1 Tax=Paeniglutamicibacter sp. NPDC091659 TaxID=3364389 RepID=UPI0037F85748
MSNTLRSELWAKTNRLDTPQDILFLPLHTHGLDAADAAIIILEHESPRLKADLSTALNLSEDQLTAFVAFLAASHDIGKASPYFQAKVPSLYVKAEQLGYPPCDRPGDLESLPHSVHSMAIIIRWLQKKYGYSPLQAGSIGIVSGGHHGRFPALSLINQLGNNPGTPGWIEAQDELLDDWERSLAATPALKALVDFGIPPKCQLLLTGLVILADWAASNSSVFDLRTPGDNGNRMLRLATARRALGLPDSWIFDVQRSGLTEYYASRFRLPPKASPSLMQETMFRLASSATKPELYILEAPTGSGKTEMALSVAEILGSRLGLNGVAFALPTMATTDAMLPRVLNWLEAAKLEGKGLPTVTLGHGKAKHSPLLAQLPRQALNSPIIHDDDSPHGAPAFVVHDFFSDRKRVLQPNVAVVTIDQILMAALNTKHYALRHLGLASKVVIIDEVHAADTHMLVFLHRALEWLASYGVPVILMSATLPASHRRELAKAYYSKAAPQQFRGKKSSAVRAMMEKMIPEHLGYPCVTQVSESGITITHGALSTESVPIRPVQLKDDLESLWAELVPRLASGGVVGIICNTVKRAQETYAFISERLPENTSLLHSRFITADRTELEAQLVDWLGPEHSGATRPELRVIVGTSVLEQSLDIDFDLLITDLAPMDLLLQRAGRLHRHKRSNRCPSFAEAEMWVRGVKDWTTPATAILRSVSAVYGEYLLLNTLAVLEHRSSWSTPLEHPHQAADLVQEAYSDDLEYPHSWYKDHSDLGTIAKSRHQEKKRRAESGLIPRADTELDLFLEKPTDTGSPIHGTTQTQSGPAREEAEAVTRVRDIEDSFEVLLMRKIGDVISGFAWQDDLADLSLTDMARIDNPDLARRILRNSVRLPLNFSRDFETLERTLNELEWQGVAAWQENPVLKGQLVLFLNENREAMLAGHHILYDREVGLLVTPPQKGASQ